MLALVETAAADVDATVAFNVVRVLLINVDTVEAMLDAVAVVVDRRVVVTVVVFVVELLMMTDAEKDAKLSLTRRIE